MEDAKIFLWLRVGGYIGGDEGCGVFCLENDLVLRAA